MSIGLAGAGGHQIGPDDRHSDGSAADTDGAKAGPLMPEQRRQGSVNAGVLPLKGCQR